MRSSKAVVGAKWTCYRDFSKTFEHLKIWKQFFLNKASEQYTYSEQYVSYYGSIDLNWERQRKLTKEREGQSARKRREFFLHVAKKRCRSFSHCAISIHFAYTRLLNPGILSAAILYIDYVKRKKNIASGSPKHFRILCYEKWEQGKSVSRSLFYWICWLYVSV